MPPTSSSALGAPTATQLARNPFRLLGLPPACPPAAVRRAADRALAQARLGAAPVPPGPRPPAAPPGDDAVRRAAHELRDPGARLLAELFWFEADPGRGDATWAIDGTMPLTQLEDVWSQATGPRPATDPTSSWQVRSPAAARNLAVLALVQLADADAADGGPGAAAPPAAAWRDAPAWWSVWLNADTTPVKVLARARELGVTAAQGLDAGGVRRALTRAFLVPYLELVTRATDRGQDVSDHLARGLTAGGLDAAEVRGALADVVDTAARRIDADVEQSWVGVQAEPSTAHEVAARLRDELTPWVALMRTADSPGRPLSACSTAVRLRADQLGDMIVACAVNYLDPDDVGEVRTAAELVADAQGFVTGEELKDRVLGTLAGLRSALEAHRKQRSSRPPRPANRPARPTDRPPDRPTDRPTDRPARSPHDCLVCGSSAGEPGFWIRATFRRSPLGQADVGELRRAGLDPAEPFHAQLPRCPGCALELGKVGRRITWAKALLGLSTGAAWIGSAWGPRVLLVVSLLAVIWAGILLATALPRRRRQRDALLAHPVATELSRLGYAPPTLEGT